MSLGAPKMPVPVLGGMYYDSQRSDPAGNAPLFERSSCAKKKGKSEIHLGILAALEQAPPGWPQRASLAGAQPRP
jgi:hypothetical protein